MAANLGKFVLLNGQSFWLISREDFVHRAVKNVENALRWNISKKQNTVMVAIFGIEVNVMGVAVEMNLVLQYKL